MASCKKVRQNVYFVDSRLSVYKIVHSYLDISHEKVEDFKYFLTEILFKQVAQSTNVV